MTKLPTESWDVTPRLDLGTYELNTVCPVTGESEGLEDHHIWRKSFTALSAEDGKSLYWVEAFDVIYPNRVALHHSVHKLITENKCELQADGKGGLVYVTPENGGMDLDLRFHLMAPTEKISKRRKKKTKEEARQRENWQIRVPVDERENGAGLLDELTDQAREKLLDDMGWDEDVSEYFVLVAVLYAFLTGDPMGGEGDGPDAD